MGLDPLLVIFRPNKQKQNNMLDKMKEMWDNRYAAETYAYGTEPNVFYKDALEKYVTEGSILLPAEGEGRNAVYAAKQGLDVTAFDSSNEAKKKALKLAEKEKVIIHYEVGDFFHLNLINQKYDATALIYAHFPPVLRSAYHEKIASLIKPGGYIILEGFSQSNLPYREANPQIGGPDKIEMLFSTDMIQNDFPDFKIMLLEDIEVKLDEGLYHRGVGKVIHFIGQKIQYDFKE